MMFSEPNFSCDPTNSNLNVPSQEILGASSFVLKTVDLKIVKRWKESADIALSYGLKNIL